MKTISLLLFLIVSVHGGTLISNALGSNMVLQRAPSSASVWGWSMKPGSTITVKFGNFATSVTSANDGSWIANLPPTQAGGPHQITAVSDVGESQTLENVLFGDVWVCGGQSNMQFTVNQGFNATQEIELANNYPNIRVFTVGTSTTSASPLQQFETIAQEWSVASNLTIGYSNWTYFSATCWFFGRDLYDDLQIPLGLVSSNWGGTPVQAWSSPEALQMCANVTGADDVIYDTVYDEKENLKGPNDPSQLWNAMIVPLLKMRITGAIWYQAEANINQPEYYRCMFPQMILDWRANFGQQFGFYFAQLAPYQADYHLPEIRLSQLSALQLPNVGFAVTIDLGDPFSPFGVIHPRDKQHVGKRLSLSARAMTYGEKVEYEGPIAVYAGAVFMGNFTEIFISFEGEFVIGNVPQCPPAIGNGYCGNVFDVQLTDMSWIPAKLSGSDKGYITLMADSELQVLAVRYLYAAWPLPIIYSPKGLPAVPFVLPIHP